MKKQEEARPHDLRDRPVPPVKGNVQEPIRPTPEQVVGDMGFCGRSL